MLRANTKLGPYVLAYSDHLGWTAATDGAIFLYCEGPDELSAQLLEIYAAAEFAKVQDGLAQTASDTVSWAVAAIKAGERGRLYSDPALPYVLGQLDGELGDYAIATPGHSFIGHKYQVSVYPPRPIFRTQSAEELRAEYERACLEILRLNKSSDVGRLIEEALLKVAQAVPYTQDCTCEDPERGLMANDCHVHTYDAMHFIGSFDFPCTCLAQGAAVA